jgi:hypothetical protein
MTTMFQQSTTCARCQQASDQTVLGSTNSFGSPDLDLRPPEMKRSTMHTWVQQCPHCQYVARRLEEANGNLAFVGSPEYQAVLNDVRFPQLARLFRTLAYLSSTTDPTATGYAYLHAAWDCDDRRNVTGATECRQQAAECFAPSKPFEDTESGATTGAMLVDILRRATLFEAAASTCQELLQLKSCAGILKQVVEFQQQLIAAQDTNGHTVEEAMKKAK